jgi:signal transduction histidine kinase/CHASE3 domain sensor protein
LRAPWPTALEGIRPGLPLSRLLRPAGSIYWRLWFGVALLVGLVGGAAAVASIGVQAQNQAAEHVVRAYDSLQELNLTARADFARAQALLRGYLLTGAADYLPQYRTARRAFGAVLAAARRRAPPGARAGLEAQQRSAATWFTIAGPELVAHQRPAVIARLVLRARPSANAFYKASDRLQTRLGTLSETAASQGRRALDTTAAWSAGISALVVVLVLAASVNVVRGITRPLASVSGAVRKLAAGEHAVRPDDVGYLEVREVAKAVNVLADEGDRLRHEQAETIRLLGVAREVGNRIRARLRVDEVVREASAAVRAALNADIVRVFPVEDGRIRPSVGGEHGPRPSGSYADSLPRDTVETLAGLYRGGEIIAITDLHGPEAERIPAPVRGPLIEAGIISLMLASFGVGNEFLGFMAVGRLRECAWMPAETRVVELAASDIAQAVRAALLYEAGERLVRELREVDKAKSDFLGAVSHELRTPLTGIVGYLDLLRAGRAGPLSARQAVMLDALGASAFRLRGLIEDVLTTSRIEAGAFKTVMGSVDLADLVVAATEALRPEAEARQVSLSVSCPEDGLVVSGDVTQLGHALLNLVSNAVKFTPAGGQVWVDAAADGSATHRPTAAVVTIRDTGIGIPEADKSHLFDRFFRASNAVDQAVPGTGIGLAIVRTIVTNHRGTIDLASRIGEGTTVTLRLPMPGPEAIPHQWEAAPGASLGRLAPAQDRWPARMAHGSGTSGTRQAQWCWGD